MGTPSLGRSTPGLKIVPPDRSRLPVTASSTHPSHSVTLAAVFIDAPVPLA